MQFIKNELNKLEEQSLFRVMKTVDSAQGKHLYVNGTEFLSFCSNNYLDISNHKDVKDAVIESVTNYGWGAGASRLVSGNMTLHQQLEQEISLFKNSEASIVFPTGYMTNVGTISSLVTKGDLVISDKLNHASIIDGCKLSQAKLRVYPHKDMEKLEKLLKTSSDFKRKLIVTDSVFSMDGDIAPLSDIISLAKEYNAMTMVDEAHATGIFGKNRRGVLEEMGLEGEADVVMGTLSKAVGSMGGFVCGGSHLIDFLRNKAKSFIYTTALPPAVCAASIAGLRIIAENPGLTETLWSNIRYIRKRLSVHDVNMSDSNGPIIPIIIGEAEKTNRISKVLLDKRLLIPAIRPPTVPRGSSRLRVTIMSSHSKHDIDRLVDTLLDLL